MRKLELTAADPLAVTSNVTFRSRRLDTGPTYCLGSTVQPAGASSSTLPRRSVPRPDLRWTVAWNVSPATLKKSDSVMCSIVPRGRPPGSRSTAP